MGAADLPSNGSFIEPVSGLRMEVGKFYLISDSGGSYSPNGFLTIGEAMDYIASESFQKEYGDETLFVPKYDLENHHWLIPLEAMNAVKADDCLDFWRFNDPEMLAAAQVYSNG